MKLLTHPFHSPSVSACTSTHSSGVEESTEMDESNPYVLLMHLARRVLLPRGNDGGGTRRLFRMAKLSMVNEATTAIRIYLWDLEDQDL